MSAHDRKAHTKKVWLDNSTSGEKKKKKAYSKTSLSWSQGCQGDEGLTVFIYQVIFRGSK